MTSLLTSCFPDKNFTVDNIMGHVSVSANIINSERCELQSYRSYKSPFKEITKAKTRAKGHLISKANSKLFI